MEVGPFCEHYGPDVDINTKNSLDHSGSNETMQKVLALADLSKKFGGSKILKIGTSVFFIQFR